MSHRYVCVLTVPPGCRRPAQNKNRPVPRRCRIPCLRYPLDARRALKERKASSVLVRIRRPQERSLYVVFHKRTDPCWCFMRYQGIAPPNSVSVLRFLAILVFGLGVSGMTPASHLDRRLGEQFSHAPGALPKQIRRVEVPGPWPRRWEVRVRPWEAASLPTTRQERGSGTYPQSKA